MKASRRLLALLYELATIGIFVLDICRLAKMP